MHMADALISPIVGGTMWIASTGIGTYSVNKIKSVMDEKKIPLMGVMGAFVFAAQMINFSIPGTGSSGHIGGGLLLAILLGPYAGFLTMASILTIQALFFADGGILALGCNIINLGFYTCFVTYPLIYRRIVSKGYSAKRLFSASLITSIIGLQLGAFSVVLQTLISGKTELPFSAFVLLMQPIHLAIGIVEGLVVATVVSFVWKTRPEIVENIASPIGISDRSSSNAYAEGKPKNNRSTRKVLGILVVATLIMGGVLSWFASSDPDGLEWAIFKTSGQETLQTAGPIYNTLEKIQEKTAILPDYGFRDKESQGSSENTKTTEGSWSNVNVGTSLSGFVGGGVTLLLVILIGAGLNIFKKKNKEKTAPADGQA